MLNNGAALVITVQPDQKIANNLQMRFADEKRVIVDRSDIGVDITFSDLVSGYGVPQVCILHGRKDILCDLSAYDILSIVYLAEGVE